MSNPVVWFEIYVHDLARATRFYEAVLGVILQKIESPLHHLQMMAFPAEQTSGGATGALVHMDGYTPSGIGTVVYFRCEDCSVEEGRVVAAGGRVERSKMPIGPYGFIALVHDTEGNLIGLHSMH